MDIFKLKINKKSISGFPNYRISKSGEVWSRPRQGSSLSGLRLRPGIQTKGYLLVVLYNKKKKYSCLVHRLVLETYVGPCPKGMQCRHLNGNPIDNRLENLTWGTPSENQQDRVLHQTSNRGVRNGQVKLCAEQVRIIFLAYHDGIFNQRELAKHFKVCCSTISDIATKKTWGYLWN